MADSLQLHYVETSSFTTRFLLQLSPDDGYRSKLQNTVYIKYTTDNNVQPNIHITDYGVRIHLLQTGGEIWFFFTKNFAHTSRKSFLTLTTQGKNHQVPSSKLYLVMFRNWQCECQNISHAYKWLVWCPATIWAVPLPSQYPTQFASYLDKVQTKTKKSSTIKLSTLRDLRLS